MGVQALTKDLANSFGRKLSVETTEDSHKAQVTFIKDDLNAKKEQETVYGMREQIITRDAFQNSFLKF